MIDSRELMDTIDREIWSRIHLRDHEKNEFGEGYNCCGCPTYSEIVSDIEGIIERLAHL